MKRYFLRFFLSLLFVLFLVDVCDALSWSIGYYRDEFEEPTGELFIAKYFKGVFSNSATSNSELKSAIVVDRKEIAIVLFEYGSDKVKNSFRGSDIYRIIMRTVVDDKRLELTGRMYGQGGDRIYIEDKAYINRVLSALGKGGPIDFYIEKIKNPVNNYLFTVPSHPDFLDSYKALGAVQKAFSEILNE